MPLAVQVTTVVPIGKSEPLGRETATWMPGSAGSVAVGCANLTAAPSRLVASTTIDAGTFCKKGVSRTDTTNVAVDVLPDRSIAVTFTVVKPMGKSEPLACETCTNGAGSTRSVTWSCAKSTGAPEESVACTTTPGALIDGGVVSRTTMLNRARATLPTWSVAVQVTTVVPRGNVEPEGGTQRTCTLGSEGSTAVGAANRTTDPNRLAASITWSEGTPSSVGGTSG
jgi:hypothetical protein